MTTVIYTNNADRFSIEINGHANYAESGKDIVCSAVSTLASELLIASENAKNKREIGSLHYEARAGNIVLSFRYRKPGSMHDIVSLVINCLYNIENQYPNNVTVKKAA